MIETYHLEYLSKLLEETTETEDYAYCDFWDFAGQRDFYATHQTFLTVNAIYLITTDLSNFKIPIMKKKEEADSDEIGGML